MRKYSSGNDGISVDNYSWPTSLMGRMPAFNGTIFNIKTEAAGISVDYIKADEPAVRDYIKLLADAGFMGKIEELGSGSFMFNGENNGNKARIVFTSAGYTVITFIKSV